MNLYAPNNVSYQLTDNDIHLWMVNPKQIKATPALRRMLCTKERDKVDRYRLPASQHSALITRAFIRLLLSKYAPLAPDEWQFSISELGKPEIKNPPLALRFNLSHNDHIIICAICLDKDIGCDIEDLTRKVSINAIAKRFFSKQEALLIKKTPRRFFEYWTLKEAFVKATGLGISQGLETFSFVINAPKETHFNDNINLTFDEKARQKSPQDWYQALLFPDDKHCIAVSVNNKKQTDIKPTIRLFSTPQGAAIFQD